MLFASADLANAKVEYSSTEDKIFWDETSNLDWKKFKVRNVDSDDAAMSHIAIMTNCNYTQTGATISVRAAFDIRKSWVQEDCRTDYILNHEQMHYNIVEIYARKMRKELASTKFTASNFKTKYLQIYNKIVAEHATYQELYDGESEHSIDKAEQMRWNQKIMDELVALAPYASNNTKIKFTK